MTALVAWQQPTDRAAFLVVFNRLSVALREPPDDSGATLQVYFDALRDLPQSALEAGAMALSREPGRRFFPTTAEWRTAAEKARADQLRQAVTPPRDEPWKLECDGCEDTGFIYRTCDGVPRTLGAMCGRHKKHEAHEYVEVCSCRPTNRTYMRHHTFGREAGETRRSEPQPAEKVDELVRRSVRGMR